MHLRNEMMTGQLLTSANLYIWDRLSPARGGCFGPQDSIFGLGYSHPACIELVQIGEGSFKGTTGPSGHDRLEITNNTSQLVARYRTCWPH